MFYHILQEEEVDINNNAFSSHLFSDSEICRERRDPRLCKFMKNLMSALTEMKPQNINKFYYCRWKQG